MNDKVSIITASYNSQKYIKDTIESVIHQTYQNWELIIADDKSSDKTLEIINNYLKEDKRIKLVKLFKNLGAGEARNKAIEKATGGFIAFLDSDDYWHKEKLEIQLSFMKQKKCNISYSSYYLINEKGQPTGYFIEAPLKLSQKNMINNDYIGFLTFMYNANILGKQYLPKLRKRQDWLFKINLMKGNEVAYGVKKPLAYYRKGHNSLSNNKFKLFKYNYNVFNKHLKYNKVKAFTAMLNFLIHYFIYKISSLKKVN